MAITALQLITSSMRLLGAVASGETPTADEQNDALIVLNDLLDSCNNKGLTIYSNSIQTFNLTAAKQTYAISAASVAPELTANRPVCVEYGYITYQGTDYPLRTTLTRDEWMDIASKSTQSIIPCFLYYEPKYPAGEIKLWPVPQTAVTMTLSLNDQFAALASLSASIAYPPGYAKWMRYQLAVELASEFKLTPPEAVVQTAKDELGDIQSRNTRPAISEFDPALTNRSGSTLAAFLGGY